MNRPAASEKTNCPAHARPADLGGAKVGHQFSASARLLGPAFRPRWSWRKFGLVYSYPQGIGMGRCEFRRHVCTLLGDYLASDAVREHEWMDDDQYYLPTYSELRQLLHSWNSFPRDTGDAFDCEDYAYLVKARFALHRADDPGRKEPSAFACGIGLGRHLAPTPGAHTLNVVFTAELKAFLVDTSPFHIREREVAIPRPHGNQSHLRYLVI